MALRRVRKLVAESRAVGMVTAPSISVFPTLFARMKTLLILCLATLSINVWAADPAKPVAPKPYPLDKCIVSGDKLGGDMGPPVRIVVDGQEVKFCCKDCIDDFNKDPKKYLKQIDEAAAKKDKK